MADKQAQAMERLTAKLTALRKTLRGDERQMLDAMVLAAQSEVGAHSKVVRPVASSKTSDVQMHSASVRSISAESKTPSASARQVLRPNAGSKTAEPEGRQVLRITLDDGNYRVTVL